MAPIVLLIWKNKYFLWHGSGTREASPVPPLLPPPQSNLCSINSKAKNSSLMTSEEQGHLKIAHSYWTPSYRIKWQEGTPVRCSCSKNRKCPGSRLEHSAREGRGSGARCECVIEEWAMQSADPGVSNLTFFWELFSTHDPRNWFKK